MGKTKGKGKSDTPSNTVAKPPPAGAAVEGGGAGGGAQPHVAVEMVEKGATGAAATPAPVVAAAAAIEASPAGHGDGKKAVPGGRHVGHGKMEEQQASAFWLVTCFVSLMSTGVVFGMVMEYATSGGRKLHELSYIFVTSTIYALTARICRDLSGEVATSIEPPKLLALAVLSMSSTFTSVRALRYVIFPVQVLAKSCKPVPVMLIGAMRGKSYPLSKYVNVAVIVTGVALFMGGGSSSSTSDADADKTGPMMWVGVVLLFVSLCFDGATGAYEDELMQAGHLGPFELMYNIQFGKMIIAFSILLFNNEVSYFFELCGEIGPLLLLLGLSGALLQISIFVTISKCGALNCALFGVARKITTLIVSILFFAHQLSWLQTAGLAISIASMLKNFITNSGKKKEKEGRLEPETVNDGPKASLTFADQTVAGYAEKKPLLEGGDDGDEEEEDAFPTAQPNTKVV